MDDEVVDYEIEQNFGSRSLKGAGNYSLQTHQYINQNLCGNLITVEQNQAEVSLKTNTQMSVDEFELVHGGFLFSAADFAAMAAVNDPNVVLTGSQTSFYAPVKVGDEVVFKAVSRYNDSRKREISVVGRVHDIKVFKGVFDAVVLERHILQTNIKKVKREDVA